MQLDRLRRSVAHASQRRCFCRWSGGGIGETRRTTSRPSQAHPGRVQKMEQSRGRGGSGCQSRVVVLLVVGEGFGFGSEVGNGLGRACLRAVRHVARAGQ